MIIIKGAKVVGAKTVKVDLAIKDECIYKIAPVIEAGPGDDLIDAEGCLLFPGGIDPHTHFAMTNALCTTADDYASGTAAALAGGTTTIINFATPEKGQKNSLHEAYKREAAKASGKASCDYAFHIELLETTDAVLREIPELRKAGHLSYKVYLAYGFKLDDASLFKAVKAVGAAGGMIGAHCENGALIDCLAGELASDHPLSPADHPLTRPPEIEAEAINRFGTIGKLAGEPGQVVHLSSAGGVSAMRALRAAGTKITAETCPQYLLLDEALYRKNGFEAAKYVCSPPLRKAEDRDALLSAIKAGDIQTLATDHCSYTYKDQKMMGKGDYTRIPGGLPGVQFRMPLAYTNLLASGLLTPEAFARLTATNAARLYGLYPRKGVLREGSDADILIYDPRGERRICREMQLEAVDYTPYEGLPVKGRVRDVFLRGRQLVRDGEIQEKGQGRYIPAQAERSF